MSSPLAEPTYRDDLGHGLIRRWSTLADQEKIAQCVSTVFRRKADAPPNANAVDEVRIMMSPGYPHMGPDDWALVEDTSRPDSPVIACLCVWSHTWSYGGIPFGVGRPELVASQPEYRQRGLIRSLFEMFHARSATRGELVQAITGIPYYYRQFGYEYVLDLGGHRLVYTAAIPAKEGDAPEPYQLRLATLDDVPHLVALYDQGRSQSLVWHEVEAAYWRAALTAWDDPAVQGKNPAELGLFGRLQMIVDQAGAVCGYVLPSTRRRSAALGVWGLALYGHVNWQLVMPSLLRALRTHGEQVPGMTPDAKPFSELYFDLGRSHPAYTVLGETLAARGEPPYAWYLRVPDLVGFLRHIAPVLEQRLAASPLTGYDGELSIDFYRGGLLLRFAQGKLVAVEPRVAPAFGNEPAAGCPQLIFLQLLFGYRSLAELRATFPDVYAEPEGVLLLEILFPKLASTVNGMSYT